MGILFKQAQTAARDGVLSTRDVGKLVSTALKNGEVSVGERKELEKIQRELESSITPDARRALNNFLALGQSFDGNLAGKIFGLDEGTGDQLESAGVSSLSDLLIASKMPEGREALADAAQVELATLTAFVEQADLARIMGVGKQKAALLHAVGINNVQELASQDPAKLRETISDFIGTPEGQAIAKRRPSTRTLTKWINNAKTLPKLMNYVGDSSKSFTKEAFDALKPDQQAMLLWGSDVSLGSGAVFEEEDLTLSVPRRKPAAISAAIREMEDSGFDGDYEHAELADIQRVKLGSDTLGYRLEFEVSSGGGMSSEGFAGPGDMGIVYVAIDAKGEVLDIDYDDVWISHE